MSLVVLVPVLGRPHRVRPLLANLRTTTPEARVLFIADPDDLAEQRAVNECGADMMLVEGSYAQKINAGVRETTEPLIFFGADDLRFHSGWFKRATTRLVGRTQVVGVNDLLPRRPEKRGHATHFLVTREYAERPTIDGHPGPLCEMYHHSFVDDEFAATARRRGAYVYAPEAHVQHLHPDNGSAPDDETYRKGRSRFRLDRRLYQRRQRQWT